MAAFNKFNAFTQHLADGQLNIGVDTPKLLLTNTLPIATNSVYADISATELAAGNGYITGGQALTVISSIQTGGVVNWVLEAANWVPTGSMGPFRYAVLYDSSASVKTLIGWWDFGMSVTITTTEILTLSFSGSALTIT